MLVELEEYLEQGSEFRVRFRVRQRAATARLDRHQSLDEFEKFSNTLRRVHLRICRQESGIEARVIEEIAKLIATSGTRFSSHNWRSVSQVLAAAGGRTRGLHVECAIGAVAMKRVFPMPGTSLCRSQSTAPHPQMWNEKTAARISASSTRCLFCCHITERRARKLDVYSHAFTTRLDESRRFSWIES